MGFGGYYGISSVTYAIGATEEQWSIDVKTKFLGTDSIAQAPDPKGAEIPTQENPADGEKAPGKTQAELDAAEAERRAQQQAALNNATGDGEPAAGTPPGGSGGQTPAATTGNEITEAKASFTAAELKGKSNWDASTNTLVIDGTTYFYNYQQQDNSFQQSSD